MQTVTLSYLKKDKKSGKMVRVNKMTTMPMSRLHLRRAKRKEAAKLRMLEGC